MADTSNGSQRTQTTLQKLSGMGSDAAKGILTGFGTSFSEGAKALVELAAPVIPDAIEKPTVGALDKITKSATFGTPEEQKSMSYKVGSGLGNIASLFIPSTAVGKGAQVLKFGKSLKAIEATNLAGKAAKIENLNKLSLALKNAGFGAKAVDEAVAISKAMKVIEPRIVSLAAAGQSAKKAAVGTSMAFGSLLESGEAGNRAKEGKATPEKEYIARLSGIPVGLLEGISNSRYLKSFGAPYMSKVGERIAQQIPQGLLTNVVKTGYEVLKNAGVEGLEEYVQNSSQNLIGKGLYNPKQEITEGSGEAFAIGALAGGIFDLVVRGAGKVIDKSGQALASAEPTSPEQLDSLAKDVETKVNEESRTGRTMSLPMKLMVAQAKLDLAKTRNSAIAFSKQYIVDYFDQNKNEIANSLNLNEKKLSELEKELKGDPNKKTKTGKARQGVLEATIQSLVSDIDEKGYADAVGVREVPLPQRIITLDNQHKDAFDQVIYSPSFIEQPTTIAEYVEGKPQFLNKNKWLETNQERILSEIKSKLENANLERDLPREKVRSLSAYLLNQLYNNEQSRFQERYSKEFQERYPDLPVELFDIQKPTEPLYGNQYKEALAIVSGYMDPGVKQKNPIDLSGLTPEQLEVLDVVSQMDGGKKNKNYEELFNSSVNNFVNNAKLDISIDPSALTLDPEGKSKFLSDPNNRKKAFEIIKRKYKLGKEQNDITSKAIVDEVLSSAFDKITNEGDSGVIGNIAQPNELSIDQLISQEDSETGGLFESDQSNPTDLKEEQARLAEGSATPKQFVKTDEELESLDESRQTALDQLNREKGRVIPEESTSKRNDKGEQVYFRNFQLERQIAYDERDVETQKTVEQLQADRNLVNSAGEGLIEKAQKKRVLDRIDEKIKARKTIDDRIKVNREKFEVQKREPGNWVSYEVLEKLKRSYAEGFNEPISNVWNKKKKAYVQRIKPPVLPRFGESSSTRNLGNADAPQVTFDRGFAVEEMLGKLSEDDPLRKTYSKVNKKFNEAVNLVIIEKNLTRDEVLNTEKGKEFLYNKIFQMEDDAYYAREEKKQTQRSSQIADIGRLTKDRRKSNDRPLQDLMRRGQLQETSKSIKIISPLSGLGQIKEAVPKVKQTQQEIEQRRTTIKNLETSNIQALRNRFNEETAQKKNNIVSKFEKQGYKVGKWFNVKGSISPFPQALLKLEKDGLFSYVNERGELVVENAETVVDANEELNDYINKKRKVKTESEKELRGFDVSLTDDGKYIVTKNGDQDGNEVYPNLESAEAAMDKRIKEDEAFNSPEAKAARQKETTTRPIEPKTEPKTEPKKTKPATNPASEENKQKALAVKKLKEDTAKAKSEEARLKQEAKAKEAEAKAQQEAEAKAQEEAEAKAKEAEAKAKLDAEQQAKRDAEKAVADQKIEAEKIGQQTSSQVIEGTNQTADEIIEQVKNFENENSNLPNDEVGQSEEKKQKKTKKAKDNARKIKETKPKVIKVVNASIKNRDNAKGRSKPSKKVIEEAVNNVVNRNRKPKNKKGQQIAPDVGRTIPTKKRSEKSKQEIEEMFVKDYNRFERLLNNVSANMFTMFDHLKAFYANAREMEAVLRVIPNYGKNNVSTMSKAFMVFNADTMQFEIDGSNPREGFGFQLFRISQYSSMTEEQRNQYYLGFGEWIQRLKQRSQIKMLKEQNKKLPKEERTVIFYKGKGSEEYVEKNPLHFLGRFSEEQLGDDSINDEVFKTVSKSVGRNVATIKKEFKDINSELIDQNREILKSAYFNGLLSQDKYDELNSLEYYIPFRIKSYDETPITIYQKLSDLILGSERATIKRNPETFAAAEGGTGSLEDGLVSLSYLMDNWEDIIQSGIENKAKSYLLSKLRNTPLPNAIKKQILLAKNKDGLTDIEFNNVNNMMVMEPSETLEGPVIVVAVNGENQKWKLNDYNLFKMISKEGLYSDGLKILDKAKGWYTALITTEPNFRITNVLQGIGQGLFSTGLKVSQWPSVIKTTFTVWRLGTKTSGDIIKDLSKITDEKQRRIYLTAVNLIAQGGLFGDFFNTAITDESLANLTYAQNTKFLDLMKQSSKEIRSNVPFDITSVFSRSWSKFLYSSAWLEHGIRTAVYDNQTRNEAFLDKMDQYYARLQEVETKIGASQERMDSLKTKEAVQREKEKLDQLLIERQSITYEASGFISTPISDARTVDIDFTAVTLNKIQNNAFQIVPFWRSRMIGTSKISRGLLDSILPNSVMETTKKQILSEYTAHEKKLQNEINSLEPDSKRRKELQKQLDDFKSKSDSDEVSFDEALGRRRAVARTFRTVAFAHIAMLVLQDSLLNYLDDDYEENIPNYIRYNYFIIPMGNGRYIPIPMTFGIGAISRSIVDLGKITLASRWNSIDPYDTIDPRTKSELLYAVLQSFMYEQTTSNESTFGILAPVKAAFDAYNSAKASSSLTGTPYLPKDIANLENRSGYTGTTRSEAGIVFEVIGKIPLLTNKSPVEIKRWLSDYTGVVYDVFLNPINTLIDDGLPDYRNSIGHPRWAQAMRQVVDNAFIGTYDRSKTKDNTRFMGRVVESFRSDVASVDNLLKNVAFGIENSIKEGGQGGGLNPVAYERIKQESVKDMVKNWDETFSVSTILPSLEILKISLKGIDDGLVSKLTQIKFDKTLTAKERSEQSANEIAKADKEKLATTTLYTRQRNINFKELSKKKYSDQQKQNIAGRLYDIAHSSVVKSVEEKLK